MIPREHNFIFIKEIEIFTFLLSQILEEYNLFTSITFETSIIQLGDDNSERNEQYQQ
jgi:hypothetical protein